MIPAKPFIAIMSLLAGGLLPPGFADAPEQRPPSQVMMGGMPVSQRPLALRVTEWRGEGAGEQTPVSRGVGANTVGSLLEEEQVRSQLSKVMELDWPLPGGALQRTRQAQWLARERGLAASMAWETHGVGWRFWGSIKNTQPQALGDDRLLTVRFSVPMDAAFERGGLVWQRHLNGSSPAAPRGEMLETFSIAAGSTGALSKYMWGGVTSGNEGLAVALPPDQPRIHRVLWDGDQRSLAVEVDVALVADHRVHPNAVPLEFWLFPFNGEHGFRSMTRAYYDLAPEAFYNRAPEQGQWMPFTQVDHVQRPEDFRFVFHEYHPNVSVAYNNANDIWSLVYCEPTVQWIQMPSAMPREEDGLFALIDQLGTPQGSAVRSSGSFDEDNDFRVTFAKFPWADGARIPMNSHPGVPRTELNPINGFDFSWAPYRELRMREENAPPSEWTGDGKSLTGIIGAGERALHLPAGREIRQRLLPDSAGIQTLRLRWKTSADGQLRVSMGSASLLLRPEHSLAWREHIEPFATSQTGEELVLRAEGDSVFVDSISLLAEGKDLISNGSFSSTITDSEAVTGLYLDSFEGWEAVTLDHRRENLRFSDEPLTYHPVNGKVGQPVMWWNFAFAKEAGRRLHRNHHLLMANTALYKFGWSGPLLDVMGIETNWGGGEKLTPPSIDSLDFIRTLSYQKAYCFLQNVPFDRFRGKKVEQYFTRCLHYGMWPGFFSHDAASDPYWENPRLYNEDRWLSLRYMQPQGLLTALGWEPVTLAAMDNEDLLLERWGGGPYRGEPLDLHRAGFTIYNPGEVAARGNLQIDPRLFPVAADLVVWDLIEGRRVLVSDDGRQFSLELGSLDVRALLVMRRDAETLRQEVQRGREELAELAEKWRRHGMITQESAAWAEDYAKRASDGPAESIRNLKRFGELLEPQLEPLYRDTEWRRQLAMLRNFESLLDQELRGERFDPYLPAAASPGYDFELRLPQHPRPLLVQGGIEGAPPNVLPVSNGQAKLRIPTEAPLGESLRVTIQEASTSGPRLLFEGIVPLVTPLEIGNAPDELAFLGDGRLPFILHNNLAQQLDVAMAIEGLPPGLEGAFASGPLAVLPASQSASFAVRLRAGTGTEVSSDAAIVVRDSGGDELARLPVKITALSPESSLLRESTIKVNVDSNFWGYTPRPLNDGVTDTRDQDWSEAAWASEEGLQPHWASFEFAEPGTVQQVTIHWAYDGGTDQTSQRVFVEGRTSAEDPWKRLAVVEPPAPASSTTVRFDPVEVHSLRIYQPAGGGPEARPGILWMEEVEAR